MYLFSYSLIYIIMVSLILKYFISFNLIFSLFTWCHILPMRSSSVRLLCHLDLFQSFFKCFHTFWDETLSLYFFLAPILKLAISSRSPVCFQWKMAFRNQGFLVSHQGKFYEKYSEALSHRYLFFILMTSMHKLLIF